MEDEKDIEVKDNLIDDQVKDEDIKNDINDADKAED